MLTFNWKSAISTLPLKQVSPAWLKIAKCVKTLDGSWTCKLEVVGLGGRWGETYTFNNLTVDGKSLTIDWVNDYGEGGITTLTRTDGKNWPALGF